MKVLMLSADDVEKAAPMAEAIAVVKAALAQLSTGKAVVPLRIQLPVEPHGGNTLFMPAYLSESDALGVKVVSVFPRNLGKGIPTISAIIIAMDATTGCPVAIIDGAYLTALRTGAASGVATELLARKDAEVAAVFGAGAQARTQLLAVCEVRDIKRALVFARTREKVEVYVEEMRGKGHIPQDLHVASSPVEAVREADVICTATTASIPVFDGNDLRSGSHINAIGAFTPQMQEVDEVTIKRADKIVVDSRKACLAEAGDIIIPLRKGFITEDDIHAELGEVATGLRPGREGDGEITYFKSVGNAVQDMAVALQVLKKARQMELGREVEI